MQRGPVLLLAIWIENQMYVTMKPYTYSTFADSVEEWPSFRVPDELLEEGLTLVEHGQGVPATPAGRPAIPGGCRRIWCRICQEKWIHGVFRKSLAFLWRNKWYNTSQDASLIVNANPSKASTPPPPPPPQLVEIPPKIQNFKVMKETPQGQGEAMSSSLTS